MLDSRKRANEKWLAANYEQISFRAPKGTRAQIKQWAEECGLNMAAYIQQACKEKSEKNILSVWRPAMAAFFFANFASFGAEKHGII